MSRNRTITWICAGAIIGPVLTLGCSTVIGLDKLSAAADELVDGGGQPACTTNAECTDRATQAAKAASSDGSAGVVPAVCLQSQGHCATLTSDDCKTVTGDYLNDRAILVGSLFTIQGTTATQNVPRQQSATLAVEEINAAGGIPSSTAGQARPLVMVSCDTSADLVRAATHLVSDLKVPAIVGPNTSQDTLDVSNKVTIQAGTVVISPTAVAASIGNLLDNDMTWLMIPSDDQRARLMIADINDLESKLKSERSLDKVKLSIIYRNDALGVGTRTSLDDLNLNGKPLSDLSNAGSATGNVHVVPYEAKQSDFSTLLAKEVAFAPDIVVLAGTAETVTSVLTPLEQQWTASQRPYYYFIDPSKGPELLAAVKGNESFRVRIRGTGTVPSAESVAVASSFSLDYTARYGSSPTASGTGTAYDATYAIAYALAAMKDSALSGSNVAAGLRKLAGGSPTVKTGPQDVLAAFQSLASGQDVKAIGTACPLNWDEKGRVAAGKVEIWCIGNSSGSPAFQSSGFSWVIGENKPTGAYTQCGP